MFKRTSIYALAAVAALGVTSLATSSAFALGGHGNGGMHGPVAAHGPMGVSVKPHKPMVTGLVINKPVVTGIIIKPKPPVITGIIINPKPNWHHHNWCKWHFCGPNWVVGAGVGVVATGVVASTPVAAAPAPCTCLTKTYLQDGSVLFKDVCTTETAIAPADQKASAN
jgi:hypothetical protein